MLIELHEKAIENFNDKFEQLLFELKLNPQRPSIHPKFESDIVVSKTITEADIIGDVTSSLVNPFGDEIAIFFMTDGKEFGFFNEDFLLFIKLCENIQKINIIEGLISFKFLKDKSFEWVRKRYKSQTSLKLWDYLKPILEESVKSSEVIIPLYMIQIESSFNIGNVTFKQLTKNEFDTWALTAFKDKVDWNQEGVEFLFEREREKHQGFAAASIIATAEEERAKEIAFEEIERAVDILRIFDPAGFHPLTNSTLTLWGKEQKQSSKCYVIKDGIFSTIIESSLVGGAKFFQINSKILNSMKIEGLALVSELLKTNNLNNFQSFYINTLQIYSNSFLSVNITDKIISILVSLEAVLLRGNEPIQQNLSERMAFALTKNGQERLKIVENVKAVYELRSKYIHHAHEITFDRIRDLEYFMINAWRFHISVIKNINNILSKEDLIKQIDGLKYFG